jgi:hypothetical protein
LSEFSVTYSDSFCHSVVVLEVDCFSTLSHSFVTAVEEYRKKIPLEMRVWNQKPFIPEF